MRRDTRAVRSRRVLEMKWRHWPRGDSQAHREKRERETKRALCSVVMGRDWLDVIEPRRCQISARRTRLPLRLSPRLHVRPRAARQNIPPNYIARKDVHLHHPFNPGETLIRNTLSRGWIIADRRDVQTRLRVRARYKNLSINSQTSKSMCSANIVI